MSRLALGTAQFGLSYGVANQVGQVHLRDATTILASAELAGIDTLDTAIAYGDSEARLGQLGVARWQIVSKLPRLPDPTYDVVGWVRASVKDSLERLKVPYLGGLLLHHPSDLLGAQGDALYAVLLELKSLGLVKKIGISIYGPDELDVVFDHLTFDIVQVPFNVLDRRLIDSGWLDRLYKLGVEIHVRSVFMQGLLLMPPARRPDRFRLWQPLWNEWDDWLRAEQLTPLQACLRYVLAFHEIRKVIVGIDSPEQLHEVLAASSGVCPPLPAGLQSRDIALLNPSNWYKL